MADQVTANDSRKNLATRCILLLAALVGLGWYQRPDGLLHVFFPTVKGDTALIQTTTGGFVLIDGGGDPAALAAALGRRMPFWERKLEAVILTSADPRRLPGQVAALARYRAGLALIGPTTRRSAILREWQRLLTDQQVPIHIARTGQQLNLSGATLRILALGDGDESGLVLQLEYGATSVLLAHAAGDEDLERLVARQLRHVQLVAFPWERDPHHELLIALHPAALVLTDGYQAERPIQQTYHERRLDGEALYHEERSGWVEWISDGQKSWVLTEIQNHEGHE